MQILLLMVNALHVAVYQSSSKLRIIKQDPIPNEKSKPKEEKHSLTKDEWEVLIGGKILNRIGALAIVIGLGFFLKYAFDNDLSSINEFVIFFTVLNLFDAKVRQ